MKYVSQLLLAGVALCALLYLHSVKASPLDERVALHSHHLAQISHETGEPIEWLVGLGITESGLTTTAAAEKSTARGMYQFTRPTWITTVKRHGATYGLPPNAKRTDPRAAALMAVAYNRENRDILKSKLKRKITHTDLYMAWLLSPQAVIKIETKGRKRIADLLPDAARANHNLFYTKTGKARTVNQFRWFVGQRIERNIAAYKDVARMALNTYKAKTVAAKPTAATKPLTVNLCNIPAYKNATKPTTQLGEFETTKPPLPERRAFKALDAYMLDRRVVT